MPMYDAPNGSKQYYIIERIGVPLCKRYLHKLGKQLPLWASVQREPPIWDREHHAFRFDTYTAACHWLLRIQPPGTHRLVYVDESTDEFKYVMDGPVDQERFDERDWKEYHHMNGKSN